MHEFASPTAAVSHPMIHQFKRREIIPLRKNTLWHFQAGAARLLTLSEEGTAITLGFWGAGDFTGQPLIGIQPCELECLMDVEAVRLHHEQCRELPQVTMAHLHQIASADLHATGQHSSAVTTAAHLAGAEVWLPHRRRAVD